jgi:hypothetical protein
MAKKYIADIIESTSITGSLSGTATTASFVNVAGLGGFVQGGNSFGAQALLGTNDNQSLALETSGSVRMFISSSGNVGIGTTSPEGKLTIQGTSAEPPTSGTTANSLLQLKGSLNNELNIGSNTVTGGYGSYIQASDNNLAASYQLNLQPNGGNVIIGGYTDAGFRLDVNGSARIANTLRIDGYDSSSGQRAIGFGGNTLGTNPVIYSNGAYLAINSKISEILYLNDSVNSTISLATGGGNVGIGTNNPQTLTHLYTATARAIPALGSAGGHFMIQTGGVIATIMGVNANGNFYLQPQHINAGGSTVYNTLLNPSGGNAAVGINYSPTAKFHVEGQDIYLTGNTDNRIRFSNFGFTGDSMGAAIGYVYRVANTQESGGLTFYTNPNSVGPASMTERMRITPDGNVLIGKDTTSLATMGTRIDPFGDIFCSIPNNITANHVWDTTNGVYRFYVNGSGTIFATNTTISGISDGRLKENIRDLDVGLSAVMALKPRRFDWKKESGNDGKEVMGFIAQEVETLFPELIDEFKKGEDSESDITYKTLRQDFIPLLVKAMQEQQVQIQELKAEIEILKNK